LILGWVNVGVLVVIEKSEEAIDAHIERRWLEQIHVKWLKANLAGLDGCADIAI
jgi:hypothetical protein